jgi:Tol biopolymer transport system component
MKRVLIAAIVGALWLPVLRADEQRARVLMQAAEAKATIEGDRDGAIRLYREAEREAGSNRALRVQVLLAMASVLKAQNDPEAQRIYQRIIDEYPEQRSAVSTARRSLEPTRVAGPASRVLSQLTLDAQSHVSRDGRWLPLIDWDSRTLVLRDLQTGQDTPLTPPGAGGVVGQQYPGYSRVSPDGKTVVFSWFNSERYDIRLVNIDPPGRAQPVRLYENADIPYLHPFAWSPDGKYVAVGLQRADRTGQLALLSVRDGILQPLESFSWRGEMSGMAFSPDGKWLAYDLPSEDASQHDVYVLAVDRSQKTTIAAHRRDDKVVTWSPDGAHLLFSSDRTGSRQLWAQRVDGGKAIGAPRSVTSDPARFVGATSDGAIFDVLTTQTSSLFRIVDFDFAAGRATSPPADPGEEYFSANARAQAEWSTDGRQLLLSRRTGADPRGQLISIVSADGSKVRDVRPQLHGYGPFIWSRDGRWLYAPGQELKGRHGVARIDTMTGASSIIVDIDDSTPTPITVFGESLDGRAVYYGRLEGEPGVGGIALRLIERQLGTGAERLIARLQGDGRLRVADFWNPQLSPNRRDIVARDSAADGTRLLTVIDVASGEQRATFSAAAFMMWAPDSRSVFVTQQRPGQAARVLRLWIDSGESEVVEWNLGLDSHSFRPHPDGRRLIYVTSKQSSQSHLRKITGVFNQLASAVSR